MMVDGWMVGGSHCGGCAEGRWKPSRGEHRPGHHRNGPCARHGQVRHVAGMDSEEVMDFILKMTMGVMGEHTVYGTLTCESV